MPTGLQDLKNVQLPSAWDAAELLRKRLKDGTTYEQMVRDIDSAFSIMNGQLNAGYLGGLVFLTTDPVVEYQTGSGGGYEDHTEFNQPDRKHARTTGHMLPLKMSDRGMGWTADFLRNARRTHLDVDIQTVIRETQDIYEQRILSRFFKMEEVSGAAWGLGATGVSVPFCDGGNGNIAFTPPPNPSRMINTFNASHDHYLRLNGITQANLETAVDHLWEHGHNAPYELIVSAADIDDWRNTTNVTGFVPRRDSLVDYGGLTDLANVDVNVYEGVVTTAHGPCRLYSNGRIPTKYWGLTKTYGANDPRNPLRVYYESDFGFGAKLVVDRVTLYPFAGAISQIEFGEGIGQDRTAAVLVENDSTGDYASPTIA